MEGRIASQYPVCSFIPVSGREQRQLQRLLNERRNGDPQLLPSGDPHLCSVNVSQLTLPQVARPTPHPHPMFPEWSAVSSCGRSVCRSVPRQQVIHTSLKRNVLFCVTKNECTLKRTLYSSLSFQCFFTWLAVFLVVFPIILPFLPIPSQSSIHTLTLPSPTSSWKPSQLDTNSPLLWLVTNVFIIRRDMQSILT